MNQILITKESKRRVEEIVSQMEGQTFHHHYHILYDIITAIEKEEINYFEIGSYCGASSSLVISHPKKVNAFCMDTFSEAPESLVSANLEKFKKGLSNYKLIAADSQKEKSVVEVKKIIKDVDLFYIDGDHSYEGCMNDFLNYHELVNKGGYVVFDDYHDVKYSPQVKHAVDYIVSDLTFGQYEVIGSFRNTLKTHPTDMEYNNLFILRRL